MSANNDQKHTTQKDKVIVLEEVKFNKVTKLLFPNDTEMSFNNLLICTYL